jgi:predicted N-formylglutamate amidohydrolase
MSYQLLDASEMHPVFERGRDGRSVFVIVVDHASRSLPKRLGDLGLPPTELERHIAWDIGALGVARQVAEALDARLVAQNYSRLVIDCNRRPGGPTSISPLGESIDIPGNMGLTEEEVTARRLEIFEPYHDHLRELLDERQRAHRPTILVGQHSMTNVFKGVQREMHAAVIYNRDRRFAGPLLDVMRREPGLIVAENEPYTVSGDNAWTLLHHGEERGLPHVEIEIRQDLIRTLEGQSHWARRIARALQGAHQEFLRVHGGASGAEIPRA